VRSPFVHDVDFVEYFLGSVVVYGALGVEFDGVGGEAPGVGGECAEGRIFFL